MTQGTTRIVARPVALPVRTHSVLDSDEDGEGEGVAWKRSGDTDDDDQQ